MGFGTSGSALVVFAALFIAMSTMYTSAGNSVERVTEARDRAEDRHHTVQETSVDVVAATWNSTSSNLTVVAENTGDTTLAVDRLDVVAEDEYLDSTAFERSKVDGRETTTWRPGERLVLEDADDLAGAAQAPARVTLVTGPGVADTAPVTEVAA